MLGLGLMGGSIGLALKARHYPGRILGFARRAATREEAVRSGAFDMLFDDPRRAVAEADLVVLCVPVLASGALIHEVAPALKFGALVTDVGSTKGEVCHIAAAALAGSRAAFIGSHPIAGSEQQGFTAARADLYNGALTILTPGASCESPHVARLQDFWRGLGSRTIQVTPEQHDELLARTSHLPHLLAAMLVGTVGRSGAAAAVAPFCGPGFRDTSRVAAGDPGVWHDIFKSNAPALLAELKAFKKEWDQVYDMFCAKDFEALRSYLETRQALRAELIENLLSKDI